MTGPLPWTHSVAAIPSAGLRVEREATPEERSRLAADLEIVACPRLTASYEIRRTADERFRMHGTLNYEVVQACVVSLEPVARAGSEQIDVEFRGDGSADPGIDVNPLAEDGFEPVEHGQIDAGRVVYEQVAAALDPYPRVAGAEFNWRDPVAERDREQGGAFAALARLKRPL